MKTLLQSVRRWMATPLVALVAMAVVLALASLFVPHSALALGAAVGAVEKTDIDALMKVVANRPVYVNATLESEFLDLIRAASNAEISTGPDGRYVENAQEFMPSGSFRGMSETDYLPIGIKPVVENSRVKLKKHGGILDMTGDVMRQVQGSEAAFLNYLETALPKYAKKMADAKDRYAVGYGYGVRARVSAKSGASSPYTITVKDSHGVSGWGDPWLQFGRNDSIVFTSALSAPITLANPGTTQAGVVQSYEYGDGTTANLTVAMDASLFSAITVNDYIATGDKVGHDLPSGSSTLVTRNLSGLTAAVDDGSIVASYMNIARSGNVEWQAQVLDASASPWDGKVSEDLLLFAFHETDQKGGGKPDLLIGSLSFDRGYFKDLKADRMFMGSPSYEGGRDELYFRIGTRKVKIRTARKLPPQVLFGVQSDTLVRFTMGEWEWDDTPGSIWNRVSDSTGHKDEYFAFGYEYDEMFCQAPAKNFRIDGLDRNQ